MLSYTFRSVNEAFPAMVDAVLKTGVRRESRNGDVLEISTPVGITYTAPWERVLFSEKRNANPFFHFFEALWILAGRNDVQFLTLFNKRMADYSDDGKTFHAPYGQRLRGGPSGNDQIAQAVQMLREDPDSRRVVLQIWREELDLGTISKDIPCNDLIMLRLSRSGALNMTVLNRSNDLVWGMLGANFVQFTVLQEYIADQLGVDIGTYTHVTNCLHAYLNDQWKELVSVGWLNHEEPYARWPMLRNGFDGIGAVSKETLDRFCNGAMFVSRTANYFAELHREFSVFPFLGSVAIPMLRAWVTKDYPFPYILEGGTDWEHAGRSYLVRRAARRAA